VVSDSQEYPKNAVGKAFDLGAAVNHSALDGGLDLFGIDAVDEPNGTGWLQRDGGFLAQL